MALVSGGRSALNPDAPLYIPAAVQQVEDFSPEWWQLITTATWFRDYWLSKHQGEDGFYGYEDYGVENDVANLLPDTIDLDAEDDFLSMEAQFEEFIESSETAIKAMPENGPLKGAEGLIRSLSIPKERGPRIRVESPRQWDKPAKCVSPKCSPRRIQQPR